MIPLYDENPTERPPIVTVALIAACVLVFFWEIAGPVQWMEAKIYALGMIPAVLFGHAQLDPALQWVPAPLTVFTSMFLHGGWAHLIGNMLYLWIFGNNVEDAMGHLRFLVFYLLCGVAAAFTQALSAPSSEIPMVGASGAISGVLGAYLLLFPHARVVVLIPMGFFTQLQAWPAKIVLGFWFALQALYGLFSDPAKGGVAFLAHVGGFIAGMLLVGIFKRRDVPLGGRPHLPFE